MIKPRPLEAGVFVCLFWPRRSAHPKRTFPKPRRRGWNDFVFDTFQNNHRHRRKIPRVPAKTSTCSRPLRLQSCKKSDSPRCPSRLTPRTPRPRRSQKSKKKKTR
ncbi:hypothetical protein LX36DRAFT_649976 [Colletotrichum falcatum]|nr:hypothetical protein LX36DRAFT_649976 [Colletotrichum falcatum]